ncbi:ATP-binding protein [Nonomuraea dietziae]|uniref:Putative ATPase/DNA-binding SARP family transcriptional activator n=1 Tax=Nonomuraea dietziae TaxID=65515 RepID=A0A7W5V5D9_9ACTN|nr:BTAD domain-containing putative transcriptional regulator [Nonomuraea dietziae]MBB3728201.1 putative ATPase/DNA-binding SARP family transcriptional activator [Nonomuraea dietziae]
MRFGILGPVEARREDGATVSVGGARLRGLLALLALDAGRIVPTERLIEGLYGERPVTGEGNALQSQISRLRRSLDVPVEFHPAGYRLVVDGEEVDAHRFERLVRQGRAAESAAVRSELLGQALALWRGPALADVREVPFAPAQAARLEELRVDVTEDRVEADLELGRHRELVTELQRLVEAHPVRERLRGQLIRALYASGRQAEALTAFEDARRTLADELGVDPSPELREIHLAALRGELYAPAAPGRTEPQDRTAGVRSALPAQLTSFVGRQDDLAEVARLLERARLVTLTGPGGAGKTRLALEAAAAVKGEVGLVELDGVAEGGDVAQAVLTKLGLRIGQDAPDPADRLVAALAGRRMLLVLDNCEHVVAAAAELAHRLLSACPDLRVLATGREALGITGESIWPVTALPDALAERLFEDRAAAVRPGFALGEDNLADVRRICQALDGLPLAIELAAARLRSLPVAEVAARLEDGLGLLSRGSRTAQPRHRTLRAVVEWSWSLLDEEEQRLARRLTVFAGGAGIEAVERVCDTPDALELLASLADKSLVEIAGDRYRMLQTIRAFCAERLEEAGEVGTYRRAHANHHLALLREAAPHLMRAEQLEWAARLDPEHDNLLAALTWAIDDDRAMALRIFADLSTYWWLRGRRGLGMLPARALLAALGTAVPEGLEAEYVICVAGAVGSGAHLENAKRLMREMDLISGHPQLTFFWGSFVGPSIDDGLLELMMERVKSSPDPWISGLNHVGKGFLCYLMESDVAGTEREFSLALDCFRSLGERLGMAMALSELVRVAAWRGERERFSELIEEALRLMGELGAQEDIADLLCHRGEGELLLGDLDKARADFERAAELARRVGALEGTTRASCGLAEVARLRGDLDEARRRYEEVLARESSGSFGESLNAVQIGIALGWIAAAEGDVEEAVARQETAFAAALHVQSLPVLASAAEGMAGAASLRGAHDEVALLLGVGKGLRGMTLPGDRDVRRVAELARAALGERRFTEAYARGAAMSREELAGLL